MFRKYVDFCIRLLHPVNNNMIKTKLGLIIFTNPVRTSKKTQPVTTTKATLLMLFNPLKPKLV
jgi:hypothetical protein